MPQHLIIDGWTKLGSAIRDERVGQKLTQTQLAARADVARSWLARVEAGHRNAELEPLLRLMSALGLSLSLHPTDTKSEHVDNPVAEMVNTASQTRRASWGLAPDELREISHG